MFVPILMIAMIFGMASVINSAQEAPVTDEQIVESKELEEYRKAQLDLDEWSKNMTLDEMGASEEFKARADDVQQKAQAWHKTIPGYKDPSETTEPETTDVTTQNAEATPQETPTTESEIATVETETTTEEASSPATEPQEAPATNTPAEPIVAPKIEEQETLIEDVSEELFPKEENISADASAVVSDEALAKSEALAEADALEPAGIDTVSLENPQGNWLFKRIWWERAEERYEKIRILVDAIWESRNTFFKERNELDRKVLDPFYMSIGIDRGELQTILAEINDFLEKQREQQGDLSEQERVLYETYSTEEETLKQLKLDVDMITNLDHAIDDALGTFMNQINRVRNYESEAWKNFKEIAHILNDTKARELYYMIEGAARNIKTISTYLEQEFFTHFHKLIDEAKTRVARVQSQMDALKEKGVLFQKQAEQLDQQTAPNEEDQEEEVVKPKPKLGWFDWISSGISDVFGYIWSVIRLPYDMIFGK